MVCGYKSFEGQLAIYGIGWGSGSFSRRCGGFGGYIFPDTFRCKVGL
ncbi:hypothetical protein CJA_3446 [Cellvibrio japonicus Ueda107]|uniref:Uncharacterized protein n=1 Tax=Cellvibrio japonicus (strain Ueda107) TaxID=498211 RepID=B3PFZ3_CELJU|nr:hypothetical protein CJA_3446 [Cellvibrio japonicus Ueda107]